MNYNSEKLTHVKLIVLENLSHMLFTSFVRINIYWAKSQPQNRTHILNSYNVFMRLNSEEIPQEILIYFRAAVQPLTPLHREKVYALFPENFKFCTKLFIDR